MDNALRKKMLKEKSILDEEVKKAENYLLQVNGPGKRPPELAINMISCSGKLKEKLGSVRTTFYKYANEQGHELHFEQEQDEMVEYFAKIQDLFVDLKTRAKYMKESNSLFGQATPQSQSPQLSKAYAINSTELAYPQMGNSDCTNGLLFGAPLATATNKHPLQVTTKPGGTSTMTPQRSQTANAFTQKDNELKPSAINGGKPANSIRLEEIPKAQNEQISATAQSVSLGTPNMATVTLFFSSASGNKQIKNQTVEVENALRHYNVPYGKVAIDVNDGGDIMNKRSLFQATYRTQDYFAFIAAGAANDEQSMKLFLGPDKHFAWFVQQFNMCMEMAKQTDEKFPWTYFVRQAKGVIVSMQLPVTEDMQSEFSHLMNKIHSIEYAGQRPEREATLEVLCTPAGFARESCQTCLCVTEQVYRSVKREWKIITEALSHLKSDKQNLRLKLVELEDDIKRADNRKKIIASTLRNAEKRLTDISSKVDLERSKLVRGDIDHPDEHLLAEKERLQTYVDKERTAYDNAVMLTHNLAAENARLQEQEKETSGVIAKLQNERTIVSEFQKWISQLADYFRECQANVDSTEMLLKNAKYGALDIHSMFATCDAVLRTIDIVSHYLKDGNPSEYFNGSLVRRRTHRLRKPAQTLSPNNRMSDYVPTCEMIENHPEDTRAEYRASPQERREESINYIVEKRKEYLQERAGIHRSNANKIQDVPHVQNENNELTDQKYESTQDVRRGAQTVEELKKLFMKRAEEKPIFEPRKSMGTSKSVGHLKHDESPRDGSASGTGGKKWFESHLNIFERPTSAKQPELSQAYRKYVGK